MKPRGNDANYTRWVAGIVDVKYGGCEDSVQTLYVTVLYVIIHPMPTDQLSTNNAVTLFSHRSI